MEIELSRVIDALPGLIWTAAADGTCNFFNQRWREYAGLTLDEVLAKGWQSVVHPDDLPLIEAAWDACLATGAPGEVDVRLRRFDGEYRLFSNKAIPLTDESGQLIGWCGINTDIEDRRRAEDAALAHQRRFRQVVEDSPSIFGLFSADGRLTFANKKALAYYGQTLEQLGWSTWRGLNFHPDEQPEVYRRWRHALKTGEPLACEVRTLGADGAWRWHLMQDYPLRDADGRVEMWCVVFTDIEEARRARAELAAEKDLLELVATGVALPQVLDALCREVEELSPGSYCSILAVDPSGKRLQLTAAPSLPDSYKAALEGAIAQRFGPCQLAAMSKAPVIVADLANDPRWAGSSWPFLVAEHGLASCWSTPVLSSDHRVLGVVAIHWREPGAPKGGERELIDRFTKLAGIAIERAKAEAELRRAYAHLTEAQRLSKTGSFTWDVEADEHQWSDEERRIWEFGPDVTLTMPMILSAIHPDDLPAAQAVISAATKGGAEFDLGFRIITRTGALKHLHVVGRRVEQIADRPVYLGAIQDVTESKEAEQALSRARAELNRVARIAALSALTASIAHEINQPLAGIITNASTCLRMLALDPPNVEGARATAQRTIRDGNRASEVIQRLRAMFTRKEPRIEAVDLSDAAREVLALSAAELQRRRIVVRSDFAEDLPGVDGDRVQLQQVILNLVLNAAEAMSAVEGRPRDLIVATARDEQGGRVRLSVTDSGAGFDPQDAGRLFEAFYSTKAEGMGIGLSISRSIVETHEGRLTAAANEGPGATFSFSIPARPHAGAMEATVGELQLKDA
jgi:PAS domain S-box-containing protein